MCIPHGASGSKSNGFEKKERPQKSVKKISQDEFEKGDPDFIDERINMDESKDKKEGFLASVFGL